MPKIRLLYKIKDRDFDETFSQLMFENLKNLNEFERVRFNQTQSERLLDCQVLFDLAGEEMIMCQIDKYPMLLTEDDREAFEQIFNELIGYDGFVTFEYFSDPPLSKEIKECFYESLCNMRDAFDEVSWWIEDVIAPFPSLKSFNSLFKKGWFW